jgi:hypothetical protein
MRLFLIKITVSFLVVFSFLVSCDKDDFPVDNEGPVEEINFTDSVIINGKKLMLAEKELIYTDDNIPIRFDGSLSTIRKDNTSMYFYHSYGCRIEPTSANNSSHKCFLGSDINPLDQMVFNIREDDYWDYNGYYQDRLQEGIWILGMYKCDNGDLLAITHSESNYSASDEAFLYTIGIGYSTNNGQNWTYCGDIIKPAKETLNIGGGAYVVDDEFIYVYYNDWVGDEGRKKKQICVARARLDDVINDAEESKVGIWNKYRDGDWNINGLSGEEGTPVIPVLFGGEDCHSDATYCTELQKYLLTVQSQTAGKLLLFSSNDGVNWNFDIEIDSDPTGQTFMPYSSFVDFDGPSDDCSRVGESFYIYYPHKKKSDHDNDRLYRRLVVIK